jgi:hypothetical protein
MFEALVGHPKNKAYPEGGNLRREEAIKLEMRMWASP